MLLMTGISIFAAAPARPEDPVQVTVANYVRDEWDFQMKAYIEKLKCFGNLHR